MTTYTTNNVLTTYSSRCVEQKFCVDNQPLAYAATTIKQNCQSVTCQPSQCINLLYLNSCCLHRINQFITCVTWIFTAHSKFSSNMSSSNYALNLEIGDSLLLTSRILIFVWHSYDKYAKADIFSPSCFRLPWSINGSQLCPYLLSNCLCNLQMAAYFNSLLSCQGG